MFMADVSIIVRRMRVQSDRAMSDLGVGFPEQSVLMILRAYGAANQDAIASRLGIDKGAVAKTIAKLEEKGLVKRAINPKNKREKIVETTPQTEQIMKAMEETLKDMAALLAATTHAPIMSTLMICEMTGQYSVLPGLLIACVLASVLSRTLRQDSIYREHVAQHG